MAAVSRRVFGGGIVGGFGGFAVAECGCDRAVRNFVCLYGGLWGCGVVEWEAGKFAADESDVGGDDVVDCTCEFLDDGWV